MAQPDRFPRGTRAESNPDGHSRDHRTVIAAGDARPARLDPTDCFAAFERPLRVAAKGPRSRVLVAISEDGVSCRFQLLGPGERAIIGRHSRCDLRSSDPSVSLRHLAVAVTRTAGAGPLAVRVWDLATETPFVTEDGVPARALTADGPCFVGLRECAVALIPLEGLPENLPSDSAALLASLPERSFASRLADAPERAPRRGRRTTVTRVRGPVELSRVSCAPQLAVGTLTLCCRRQTTTCYLGDDQLARGVLLGRYDRCVEPFEIDSISRVHLLIAKLGTEVVAIDTASTNGSAQRRGAFAIAPITAGEAISLAGDARVIWRGRPRGNA